MILLTPGPCMTSDSVRAAAAAPDQNHREAEFETMSSDVRRRILDLYSLPSTQWRPYILGGSGTAAVEAMLTSCIDSGPVLVIENGYYSGRIAEILAVHSIPHDVVKFDWETPIDVAQIGAALLSTRYESVVMTHHETTLGHLNPISTIGALCAPLGVRLLVDAMSSFGSETINFDVCDAVCSSANKSLRGLPGISFVLVNTELASQMARIPRRSYYLHLPMYGSESAPLTLPTAIFRAFHQALVEMPSVAQRRLDNLDNARYVRERLTVMGVEWFEPGPIANCLVSIKLERFGSLAKLSSHCQANGFLIYGCKAHLAERYFQISWMGTITRGDLAQFLTEVLKPD